MLGNDIGEVGGVSRTEDTEDSDTDLLEDPLECNDVGGAANLSNLVAIFIGERFGSVGVCRCSHPQGQVPAGGLDGLNGRQRLAVW